MSTVSRADTDSDLPRRRPTAPRSPLRSTFAVAASLAAFVVLGAYAAPALAQGPSQAGRGWDSHSPWSGVRNARPRTIVTTDGEQDDMASFIRYLMYSDDFNTVGLVYTSSQWHWCGDGKGTLFDGFSMFGGSGRSTSDRCTGLTWIQSMIGDYATEYPNLRTHDPNYPSPQQLLSIVRDGNTDFPGEITHDTAGSDLIKHDILDDTPGPLYLQAWGGLNTIVRALVNIQNKFQNTREWPAIQAKVSHKVVIEASGFQDCIANSPFNCSGAANNLNLSYIEPNWPNLRVIDGENGYDAWGYPHGQNNVPASQLYYSGAWIGPNIVARGPLGADEYTYGDGHSDGDPGYTQWDDTSQPKYSFVSEGDNVAFLDLINTGLQSPDPTVGGWGGRFQLVPGFSNQWTDVPGDIYNGAVKNAYDWDRWFPDAQNDFAARMLWGVQSARVDKVSEPIILGRTHITARPGQTVGLRALVFSLTDQQMTTQWSQYQDVGTYPGTVTVNNADSATGASVTVPSNAQPGQTIVLILSATTVATPSMTHYARVTVTVR